MSIRSKMTLLIAVLLAATSFAAGAILYWAERAYLLSKTREARQSLADHFTQTCLDAAVMNDDLAALNAAADVARGAGAKAAFVVDEEGRVRAHSDARRMGRAAPAAPETADELWITSRRTADTESLTGVLVFSRAATTAEIARPLSLAFRRIAGALAAALLLGSAGAALLALHLTRPIRRIAEGTHRLAEGRRGYRLEVNRGDELGALACDFNRMSEALGALDAMKDDFVANVTHELRSPLAAIESVVNLMTERARRGRGEDLIDHLAIVRNNTVRLGKFVNDVLDLAKIDSRSIDLARTAVDVGDALAETAALFDAKAREKGVALAVEPSPAGLTVSADADKLQQILINLTANAVKFTPAGGRVTLSARDGERLNDAPAVRIDVADTGPGIAPEDQKRIFDRFEQVRERRTGSGGAQGTGLGLAITRGLVEAHGGAIRLASAPGRGSIFSVVLPR